MGASGGGPDQLVAGRYRLEHVLGQGGMGVVWRAVDTLIERTVALKELRPPAGLAGSDESSSFVERALREARNAGRLNHPGVVGVHDVIAPTGGEAVVYIVMEFVDAPSLAEIIDRDGPLPPARAAAMGVGILEALTAAHAMGIVHRDIKPGNVLVPAGDRVKLTDFGIALAAEDTRLTRTGVMGTHAYLAPECFDDGQVGPATDLWALGATLFHAVAGRPPFSRDTTTATLRAILFEETPPPPCPPPLAGVITGLLTRSVDQRLTGSAAHEQLQRAVATLPTVDAPPPPPMGTTAGPGAWSGQATTHHRSPGPSPFGPPTGSPAAPPPPPGPPGPQGPPSGPLSAPPGPPPVPPGPAGPPPAFGASASMPAGPPPRQRSNTPLILGLLGAAAAVLLVVIFASSGGSDDDPGAGSGSGSASDDGGGLAAGEETPELPSGGGLEPGQESDPAVTGGQELAREFLDLVESGDSEAAIAMLCDVGDSTQTWIDNINNAAGDADLELDMSTAELVSQGIVLSVDLTGTVNGEPVGYAGIGTAARDDCIVTFSASP